MDVYNLLRWISLSILALRNVEFIPVVRGRVNENEGLFSGRLATSISANFVRRRSPPRVLPPVNDSDTGVRKFCATEAVDGIDIRWVRNTENSVTSARGVFQCNSAGRDSEDVLGSTRSRDKVSPPVKKAC